MNAISVLVVDDDGEASDGEASDGDQALTAVRSLLPDVVLMDVRMPRVNGIEATRRIRDQPHAPHVIVLTTFDTDDHVLDVLAAGADGFLVKDTSPSDLIEAIKTVAAGETMLSPSVANMRVQVAIFVHEAGLL